MEKIEAMVPPPLRRGVENFRDREGFENDSQAVRELLRRGLRGGYPNREDMESVLE